MKIYKFLVAVLFAIVATLYPNTTANAQSSSNYSPQANTKIGYEVMEDTLGGYWATEVRTVNGLPVTVYLNLATNTYGTPPTPLYAVHNYPKTKIIRTGFKILKDDKITFLTGQLTSISITALDGTIMANTLSMPGSETLPLHTTVGLSVPLNGDGYRYALEEVHIVADPGIVLITWTE